MKIKKWERRRKKQNILAVAELFRVCFIAINFQNFLKNLDRKPTWIHKRLWKGEEHEGTWKPWE